MATAANNTISIPLEDSIPKAPNSETDADQSDHSPCQDHEDNADISNCSAVNINLENIDQQSSNSLIDHQHSETPSVDHDHPLTLSNDCSREEIITMQPGTICLQPIASNSQHSPIQLPSPTIEDRLAAANSGNQPAIINRK